MLQSFYSEEYSCQKENVADYAAQSRHEVIASKWTIAYNLICKSFIINKFSHIHTIEQHSEENSHCNCSKSKQNKECLDSLAALEKYCTKKERKRKAYDGVYFLIGTYECTYEAGAACMVNCTQ